jgi:hypothetical protein
MSNWKERFAYNTKSGIEHEVNGHTMRFYPNRIGLLTELAEISKPVAHALEVLMSDSRGDSTSVSEEHKEKPRKGKDGIETADFSVNKITVEAVSPAVADHRRKERHDAIDQLLDGVTNQRTRLLFGKLLMDSMREEFEYKKDRPLPEVEEFLFGDKEGYEGLDTPILVQMVVGWLKANAKCFGSAGEKVVGLVKGRLEALQNLSASEPTASTTDGSSSKKPSLVLLGSDSDLNSSKS